MTRAVLSPSAKVGITTVAVIIVVIVVGFFFGWWSKRAKTGFELWLHFDSIRGLKTDAQVQFNGRPVGNVTEWSKALDQGVNVLVRFNNPDELIHQNAKAVITAESVLGQKIISISEDLSGIPLYGDEDDPAIKPADKRKTWLDPSKPVFRISTGTLQVGDPIYRQAGPQQIPIGEVIDIAPHTQPEFQRATLALSGTPIDAHEALVARQAQGGLGRVGMVYPPRKHREYIEGYKEPEASDIIASVDDVVKEINFLIGTLAPQIESITGHLDDVLIGVRDILDKEQIDALFTSLQRELTNTGRDIDLVTGDLRRMLADSQPYIDNTLASAQNSAQSIEHITAEMDHLVSDPAKRAQIESMLTELEASSKKLNAILGDIESITSDDEVKGDVKGTIKAARSTLEQVGSTLDRVTSTADGIGGHELGAWMRQRYQVEPRRSYTDAGITIDKPRDYRFYIGASNIGENTSLDAGYGAWLGDNLLMRGGLRRGKVGIGADLHFNPFELQADLYNANDPTLDLFGLWQFDEHWNAQLGVEDVLDEGTDRVTLGAGLKF